MIRLTREESRALTREKLILAAGKVFSLEGFGGASIDRIVEEAGFTKGAFYSNFSSKQDIFLQLVETFATNDNDTLEAKLTGGGSDPEKRIDAVCEWATENSSRMEVTALLLDLARFAKKDPELNKRKTEFYRSQQIKLGTLMLRIFPKGKCPATALELGALLAELTFGNAVYFDTGPTAGDLIGLYLRALLKAAQA